MAKQGTKKGSEAEVAERKIKSFDLRKKGYSYRAIGKELDISRQTAYTDVWDTIKDLHKQAEKEGKEYIQIEEEKLNDYLKILDWRIGIGDKDAIDQALKIHQRFCKLRGIEAPVKISHSDHTGTGPLEINVKLVD